MIDFPKRHAPHEGGPCALALTVVRGLRPTKASMTSAQFAGLPAARRRAIPAPVWGEGFANGFDET